MRDWNCKHTLHIRNPLLLHFFHTFHMAQQKDDRVNTGEGLRSWNDDGCGLWKHGKKWMSAGTYRRYAGILWNRTNAWTFPLIVKNKQNCYICSSLSFHFKHDQYEMLAKYIWYVVCESGVRKLGPIGNTALNKCTAKTCCFGLRGVCYVHTSNIPVCKFVTSRKWITENVLKGRKYCEIFFNFHINGDPVI